VSRVDSHRGLEPSILDRLIPQDPAGLVRANGASVEQLVEAVRRDLEDLLNTRQTQRDLPSCYEELTRSVFTFGIPDVSLLSAMAQESRGEMARIIGELIERFEPRLRDDDRQPDVPLRPPKERGSGLSALGGRSEDVRKPIIRSCSSSCPSP